MAVAPSLAELLERVCSVADPRALGRICRSLTPQKVQALFDRWSPSAVVATLLDKPYTPTQMSYDLRRLQA
jgi:hypothetical protein